MTKRLAAITLGVWISGVVMLLVANARPDALAVGAVVVVAAVGASVLRSALASVETLVWPVHPEGERERRLEDRMEITLKNELNAARRSGSRSLEVKLIAVVDERLATRHRIDRQQDPVAADELLDPSLRSLVDTSSAPVSTLIELRRVLDSIEDL